MSEVKWIKIKVDIFNDEKIQLIETMPDADTIIVIWFKLLALAGVKNDGGIIRMNDKMAYTDEMLAVIFRRKPTVIKLALELFKAYDMVDIIDNRILITNWEKHQNIDGLDKIKLQNKERQQKFRDNQKTLLLDTKEKNKELDIKNKSKRKTVTNTLRNVTKELSLLEIAINDFKDFRKKSKKPMTDKAVTLLTNKLNKMTTDDNTKIEILEQSIMNGWSSVYELNGKKDNKQEPIKEMRYAQYEEQGL